MLARLGLSLAATRQISIDDVIALARLADELSYESLWIPETWGVDAVSLLAVLARETQRIELAAGVFNVYSRSAMLIAQSAATLQELSGGRFILGLGASGPGVIERWHGMPYTRPLERTRDYVTSIRLALSGSRVDYQGGQFQLEGFTLANAASSPVPIFIASLGPRNVRLTGEIADGWLPIFAARGLMAPLYQELEAGAESAGRSAQAIDVAAYIPGVLGPRAGRLLRQQIAYYVGGMGTFYAGFVSRAGLADAAAEIRRRWQAGDRLGAVDAVDQVLLDVCTLGTDAETAQRRLDEYRQEGVGLPVLTPPHGSAVEEITQTIEALAPV